MRRLCSSIGTGVPAEFTMQESLALSERGGLPWDVLYHFIVVTDSVHLLDFMRIRNFLCLPMHAVESGLFDETLIGRQKSLFTSV